MLELRADDGMRETRCGTTARNATAHRQVEASLAQADCAMHSQALKLQPSALPMTRLLVVDDRPLDAAVAVRLLRGESDWDVEQFSSGAEALASLIELRCDLVLTDLHMPGMDGLELMKQVHRTSKDVPVVVMTSRGNEQKAVAALESGAASYLPKSRLESDLVPTCRRVLDSSKLRRDQAALMNHLVEERFEMQSGERPRAGAGPRQFYRRTLSAVSRVRPARAPRSRSRDRRGAAECDDSRQSRSQLGPAGRGLRAV